MKKMFDYLDRYYLKSLKCKGKSLLGTAQEHYKAQVFDKHMNDLRVAILNEIIKERDNEMVDKDVIKEAVIQFMIMAYEQNHGIQKQDS